MELLYSAFLGLLQGAAEFLPISSSGHLVIAENFFHIEGAGMAFDVALHMGTLLAVAVYFKNDLLAMLQAVCKPNSKDATDCLNRKMAFLVSVATVPGVVAGVLFENAAESTLRRPEIVAFTLVFFGGLLLWSDIRGKKERDFQSIGLIDAVIIGLSQAFAIIPGVSRSGITMTAGLFRTLDREATARFSFLMSVPIIAGAGLYNLKKIITNGLLGDQFSFYLTGFVVSALAGYFFISFLMRYIQTKSFAIFAYYRFALAFVIVIKLILG